MPLGKQTEEGLKHLFMANSEDHLMLLFSSEAYEYAGRVEEAKKLKEKAYVELGHAKGILEKIIQYNGIDFVKEWLKELESSKVPDDEPLRFMHYATLYLLYKLLTERNELPKEEGESKISMYYDLSRKAFQDLLDSGKPPA